MKALLILPALVAGGAALLGLALIGAGRDQVATRLIAASLWVAGALAVWGAVGVKAGVTLASLGPSPLGTGAAAMACAGAALALGRAEKPLGGGAPQTGDVTAPLAAVGCAGLLFALQSGFLVPLILYLAVPAAAALAARPAYRVLGALAGAGLVGLTLGMGGLRRVNGGWALQWATGRPPGPGSATGAVVAMVAALLIVMLGCLIGTTRTGQYDGAASAAGWPLIAAGLFLAVMLAESVGPGPDGAAPGALVVLGLSAALALTGAEAAPLSAALLATGVALSPGCGSAEAGLVAAGAYAGVLLESTGSEPLRRYGRWCRSGLPGGALFPGLAIAVSTISRADAPGGARAATATVAVVAALITLCASAPSRAGAAKGNFETVAGGIALGVGAAWLALLPGGFASGWAEVAPLTTDLGSAVAQVALVAAAVAAVASLGARLAPNPVPPMRPPMGLPDWRLRLGEAIERVPRPPFPAPTIAAAVLLSLYAVAALRLLFVGVRAGFL